ncbi:MAG: hypothetical protein DIU80_012375 [Chloroflexota bacterium]|nr:MAG: hypothetical protein DIU80_08875 [Chloroflexota bacterium]
MRFAALEQVAIPCVLAEIVPGKLHPDGRRYLPLIVLQLPEPPASDAPHVRRLGVVDRHHVVDPALVGRSGTARLVFLLSLLRLQPPPYRQGIFDEQEPAAGRASTAVTACGVATHVPAWEAQRAHLPYEALYTELVLDVGCGTIGVRTSTTAESLAEAIGKPQIEPGDWLCVRRSRIDILAFEV